MRLCDIIFALPPILSAMVLGAFPQAKRAVAVSLWGAVGALAAAVGPSLGSFVIATVGYWVYWKASHSSHDPKIGVNGPHGGSIVGLVYGFVGMFLILWAMFLAAKKKMFRTVRLFGRAYWWMQGHIWFGTLAYVLILYHAGFAWGGALTQVLMYLFTAVVTTGIFGLISFAFADGT